jgi:hypothetical protein
MGGLLGPQAHISPPHERLVRAPSGGEELGREGSTFGEERDQEESDCGREGSTPMKNATKKNPMVIGIYLEEPPLARGGGRQPEKGRAPMRNQPSIS